MKFNRTLVYVATQLSLLWAFALTGLVAINNSWVLDRAAGGYFKDGEAPTNIRIAYAVQCLMMVGIAWLEHRYFAGSASDRQRLLGRAVVALFGVSAAMNAFSQSPTERINAVGAIVIALGTRELLRTTRS